MKTSASALALSVLAWRLPAAFPGASAARNPALLTRRWQAVSGDIHDIGKDILGMLLSCYGFTVSDLAVDGPPTDSAQMALETKPDFVGLSGLIAASFEMMSSVSLCQDLMAKNNADA